MDGYAERPLIASASPSGPPFRTREGRQDHGREIRAYTRDPGGHLIEVGQTTSRPGTP